MYIDYISYQVIFTKSQLEVYQHLYSGLFFGKNSGYNDTVSITLCLNS